LKVEQDEVPRVLLEEEAFGKNRTQILGELQKMGVREEVAWLERAQTTGVFYLNPAYLQAREMAWNQIADVNGVLGGVPVKRLMADPSVRSRFAEVVGANFSMAAYRSGRGTRLASDYARYNDLRVSALQWFRLVRWNGQSFDVGRARYGDALFGGNDLQPARLNLLRAANPLRSAVANGGYDDDAVTAAAAAAEAAATRVTYAGVVAAGGLPFV
jgi:hypothetical protein